MSQLPSLGFPRIGSGATNAEAQANEALHGVDAVLMCHVQRRDLTSPPAANDGEVYVVGASATGAWAGEDNNLAYYYQGVWFFHTPHVGFIAWCSRESHRIRWTGSAWVGEQVTIALREDANQSISGATNLIWTVQTRFDPEDETFTHSTSSNQDQIVLEEAGDYEVSADITFEATGSSSQNRIDLTLTLTGSTVTGSTASIFIDQATQPRQTLSLRMVITATAGAILRVVANNATGSSTINALADMCRCIVTKL